MNMKHVCIINLTLLTLLSTVSCRNQACNLLVVVDDSVVKLFNGDQKLIKKKVSNYVEQLNDIYESTILADPPNDNIFFQVKELRILQNFLPDCKNKQVLLDEISKLGTSSFCLAHLLTFRDVGCVEGLANLGGLCKRHGNTGWSKVDPENDDVTVNTIAHEIGHNFGSEHDGGNSSMYRGCGKPDKQGIMAGKKTGNFSTCSLSAMHARLQTVLKEEKERNCFVENAQKRVEFDITNKDYSGYTVACPDVIDDDCEDDQPDPPDIPEPPPEPECGDLKVEEPYEECDCGYDYKQCQDPCCYPATISQADLKFNSSAKPCTRNQTPICLNPNSSLFKFGLFFPILFILLLIILLGIILWVDWRCGKRLLYFHITQREKNAIHVENEEQRERRLQRETLNSKNGK
eukprot:GFUD01032813.1.p1 GENE.GFUD01032813.1~~GFUD01032813.1.p1  ORF type:complete len:404 (+),score=102.04 GFUD01032813.1:85-1296(+)